MVIIQLKVGITPLAVHTLFYLTLPHVYLLTNPSQKKKPKTNYQLPILSK